MGGRTVKKSGQKMVARLGLQLVDRKEPQKVKLAAPLGLKKVAPKESMKEYPMAGQTVVLWEKWAHWMGQRSVALLVAHLEVR